MIDFYTIINRFLLRTALIILVLVIGKYQLKASQQQATIQSRWGHYVSTGIKGGGGAFLMNVKIRGANEFWTGTFAVQGLISSYTAGTNTWNTVSLIDHAVYNTGQNTVQLRLMSNDDGTGFTNLEAVISTDPRENGGEISVEVSINGIAGGMSLTTSATSPYTYTLSTSADQYVWNSRNFNPNKFLPLAGGAVTGDLGIGTSPVGPYKLSVKGDIKAQSIRVELTGWPDYVFADKHNLVALPDLENFIKANRHLPEIPSATEVKEKGIDLGEMNSKLLQKIEELTLYLIEQGKEIEKLKTQVTSGYKHK